MVRQRRASDRIVLNTAFWPRSVNVWLTAEQEPAKENEEAASNLGEDGQAGWRVPEKSGLR